MAAPLKTPKERRREELEEARRAARRSLRLGTLGIVVLFLSGIGVLLAPAYVFGFIAGMVAGIVLLLLAFFLMRGVGLVLRAEERTKIY